MTVASPSLVRGRPNTANQVPTISTAAAATGQVAIDNRFGGQGILRCVKVSLTALAVTLTDDGSTGHGSLQLLDMPEGFVCFVAGVMTGGTLSSTQAGNIQVSVGTAAAGADGSLSTTEANICVASSASTSAWISPTTSYTAAAYIDGHTSASDVYLNLVTSGSDGGVVTLTGDIYIYYFMMADV